MNGVSGNRFAPNNSYTREQSIATMLRLYDTKYAVKDDSTSGTGANIVLLTELSVPVCRRYIWRMQRAIAC